MKNLNKKTNQPWKVLWFGDLVAPSGFGRIGTEICKRLAQRGYNVQGAAINYSGWPHGLPFHVWPLPANDIWNAFVNIVNTTQPDIIVSCQDFPYHQTIWSACRIDFSRIKWVWITPIDGTPVHPDWIKLCDFADGRMVISRFGVEALRQAGKRVELCHPGVDAGEFYPASPEEKQRLRELAGYQPDEFIVGTVCMNQGRKAIPPMIEAFHEFAKDKPEARLYLDMDKTSPAGWDIPNLLKQMGWSEAEQKRVRFREDVWKTAGEKLGGAPNELLPLRNRYALLDLHMVISHREGFGLPLLESMACRVPTMALDWCSGTEIIGNGRGWLVRRTDYMEYGTWGGAKDAFPDMNYLVGCLNQVHRETGITAQRAEAGYEWAKQQTWDVATDQTENVIQQALKRERKEKPSHEPFTIPTPNRQLNDVGSDLTQTSPPTPLREGSPHSIGGDPVVQQPGGAVEMPAVPV